MSANQPGTSGGGKKTGPGLPACKVCSKAQAGKYRCPVDDVPYCSVVCFKSHKLGSCSSETQYQPLPLSLLPPSEKRTDDDRPRKRLKDLHWPPEPDSGLWDDPLLRDDVKPLRGFEYEALATSQRLRALFSSPALVSTLERLTTLPRSSRPAALRILLSLPEDPAPTFYRPSPSSNKFSTSTPQIVPGSRANRGRGRGRGRGGGMGRGGDDGEWRLVESTPEERQEVQGFVETVLGVLQGERGKRGEQL